MKQLQQDEESSAELRRGGVILQSSQLFQETRPKIIAAIPCFNTGSSIADTVSKAKKYVDQVVVVDDGSYDGTAQVARAAGALVVSHDTNRGYGEAIKSCFEAMKAKTADVLVTLDGDGQHNPDEIPHLLAPVLRGEAELIIGSRFLTDESSMPRYRKFGISVITFLFNLGSKTKVSDAQSGFRAYTRKVVEAFNCVEKGMSVSIETLVKARKKGFIIKEVPIFCFYPPSKLNIQAIKHGLSVAFSVIRIRFKSFLTAS